MLKHGKKGQNRPRPKCNCIPAVPRLDNPSQYGTLFASSTCFLLAFPPSSGYIIFRIDLQASVAGMPRTAATGSFLPLIRHLSDCHIRINPTFFLLLPSSCPPPVTTREYSPIAIIRLPPFSSNFSSELTLIFANRTRAFHSPYRDLPEAPRYWPSLGLIAPKASTPMPFAPLSTELLQRTEIGEYAE